MLYSPVTAEKRTLPRSVVESGISSFPAYSTHWRSSSRTGFDGSTSLGPSSPPTSGCRTSDSPPSPGCQPCKADQPHDRSPALVDADTGFGEPMNVARTVQGVEDVVMVHSRDQVN
jgi:hypothetical protein